MGKKFDLNKKPSFGMNPKRHPMTNNRYNNQTNNQTNNQRNFDEYGNEIPQDENNTTTEQNNTHTRSSMFSNFRNKYKYTSSANISELKDVTIKFPKVLVVKLLIIILPIVIFAFLATSVVILFNNTSSAKGLARGGYYASKCPEITVVHVKKDPVETETVPLEDYVAGVVAAELGGYGNKEMYKIYALAARTYVLRRVDESCTIGNSSMTQNYMNISESDHPYHKMIYEAVEETAGQVIIENGKLKGVEYDAFCSIDVDENYYTIKQQNQKIPVEWVEEHSKGSPKIYDAWKQGTCKGNHGRGISTWGAYYLVTEKGYTCDEILTYYLGDDITIATNSFTSIAGLDVKVTTSATNLSQPLGDYLEEHGSSLEELNTFISDSVADAGYGTREGVVVAAVSMINFLYDNFNIKLPYWWGGQYNGYGLPEYMGRYQLSTASRGGNVNTHRSFDCSGFVSWAIKNGGYDFSRLTTKGFHGAFAGDSCNVTSSSCIGKPGDLINASGSHVELIVAVDEAEGKYIIAHSGGGSGVTVTTVGIHSKIGGSETRILFMDNYYENEKNVTKK